MRHEIGGCKRQTVKFNRSEIIAEQRGGAGTRKIKRRPNTGRKAEVGPLRPAVARGRARKDMPEILIASDRVAGVAEAPPGPTRRAVLTDLPSGGPEKAGKGGALFASLPKSVPPAEVIAGRSGQDRYTEAVARTKIGPCRARHHFSRGRDTPGEAGRGLPDKLASAPARAAGGRRSGSFCLKCLG